MLECLLLLNAKNKKEEVTHSVLNHSMNQQKEEKLKSWCYFVFYWGKKPDQENINKNTKIPIDKIFLYHVEKQEDTR